MWSYALPSFESRVFSHHFVVLLQFGDYQILDRHFFLITPIPLAAIGSRSMRLIIESR